MEFVYKRVKSFLQNNISKPIKETSISVVILLSAIFLIAGAAYAAELQSPQNVSAPTTTVPIVTPPTTKAPTTTIQTTTTTTIPNLTLEQWGSLYVHLKETDPASWTAYAESKRALYGRCGEWYDLALSVGWPSSEWPTLSKVLYRESRCNWNSHNKTDPNSGSRGLMQINGYWCRKSQWTDRGWLQDKQILNVCDDLYNPTINLKAGLAIWLYGEQKHGCGWRGPWATPCS